MVQPADIKPEALVIDKAISTTWNYQESVKKVQGLYVSWKTASVEMLQELSIAKAAITLNGTRTSGLPKKGQISWGKYVAACFDGAISKRSVDSYLARFEAAGGVKPNKLTVNTVSDPAKVVIRNVVRVGDRISFDIYLPEYDLAYPQSIAA